MGYGSSSLEGKAGSMPAEGTTRLRECLSRHPASPDRITPIFLAVVAAVERAQRDEDRLCDLNPERVLIGPDGRVKLSFLPPSVPGATMVLDSVKYCAPEQLEDEVGSSQKGLIDSYRLGFIFYEILLGSERFQCVFESVVQAGSFGWLSWHVDASKIATPLHEILPGFPIGLSRVVAGMMAKNASARMTDAGRIAAAIGGASQATVVIRRTPALQAAISAQEGPKVETSLKTETLWGKILRAVFRIKPRALQLGHSSKLVKRSVS